MVTVSILICLYLIFCYLLLASYVTMCAPQNVLHDGGTRFFKFHSWKFKSRRKQCWKCSGCSYGSIDSKDKGLHDGKWKEEDAVLVVPGDIVSIKLGDIVPSDARLLEGDVLKIDQSALTGESLLVTKNQGDGIYSGSTCKQGEIDAVIIATGVHTFFGKAAHLVENTTHAGHFELSGAKIKLIEDGPQATDNVIQISGTPEQAERAQSLLQGFILSTLEED